MYLAQMTFGTDWGDSSLRGKMEEAAEYYLGALERYGQIGSQSVMAWSQGKLKAWVWLARPDSLDPEFWFEYVHRTASDLKELFGQFPECQLIDDEIPSSFRSWEESDSLTLYNGCMLAGGPLYCGATGDPVPLYLLPLKPESLEILYYWGLLYRSLDELWIRSDILEIESYTQLADPSSELSIEGREFMPASRRRDHHSNLLLFVSLLWQKRGRGIASLSRMWKRLANGTSLVQS